MELCTTEMKSLARKYSFLVVLSLTMTIVMVIHNWHVGGKETLAFSEAGWTYKATVRRFTTVEIIDTTLLLDGVPLNDQLRATRVKMLTPLGLFYVKDGRWFLDAKKEAWWNPGYQPPKLREGKPWVPQLMHTLPIEDFLAQGYYETSILKSVGDGPWIDRQLLGTPPDWVYVFKQSTNGYRGFWVHPENMIELPWE